MLNTIYAEKYHYTYQITEISTNMKYIGVRSSEVDPILDIGVKYFSSSTNEIFRKNQKENPSNYMYEVISIFDSREDANNHEIELHKEYDVSKSELFYNKTNANSSGFCASGFCAVKDKDDNIYFVQVNDPRYLSGELVPVSKGKCVVTDKNGNNFFVSVDDPRIKSGELVSPSKGKCIVKDKNGNKIRVDMHEYRNSNEYTHINVGFAIVIDENGKKSRVPVDDPRYISGELKSLASKKFRGKLVSTGKNITVNLDDPRIKSGEIVGITKGLIPVKDKDNNYTMCAKDDPRYISGELVGVTCGQFPGKDKYGNRYTKISKTDERVLSGDIIHHSAMWYKVNGEIYSMKQLLKMYPDINIKKRIKSEDYPDWICIGK